MNLLTKLNYLPVRRYNPETTDYVMRVIANGGCTGFGSRVVPIVPTAINATSEQLWLQTSEGPRGNDLGLTQVLAVPLTVGPADPLDAHPEADPVVCG